MPERAIHPVVASVSQALASYPGGIVAAVSGGPDSVALLLTLLQLRSHDSLVLAHLNHQLRGEASDADENFVRGLQAKLANAGHRNLVLEIDRLNVAALAQEAGDNLEATARRFRYRWLAEIARRHGIRHVATGHTADDQAETVLFRLLRGAGLQGLRGIARCRPLESEVHVIRPMLDVCRTDVLSFLNERSQSYCIDQTNLDRRLTRNRIRHELLPHLAEHYNPAICEILCRVARAADERFREEAEEVDALLFQAELPCAGGVLVLDVERLQTAPRSRIRSLFRRVWERQGWPMGRMGFEQWHQLERMVHDGRPAMDFPGHIRCRRRNRVIQLGPSDELS